MLNKYNFSNNQAVVDLPSIWKIGNGEVRIKHAAGTNVVDIPDSGYLTVKVGNIFSIQEQDKDPIEAIEIENPNSGNNSGNENQNNNSGNDSGNTGNEGNNENLGGSENQGGNTGNEGGNTTPSGETYKSGVANITIINNSSYYFDNNHTVSSDGTAVGLQLSAYAKIYVLDRNLSITLSMRDNSLASDTSLDQYDNPYCRSMTSGFTLDPGLSKTISNVHWEVLTNDTADYAPLPISTSTSKHTLYVGNGYYSTSGSNGLGIVTISISGENGYFKNGGSYTITIS